MSGTSIHFFGTHEMEAAAQKMRMGAESRVARGTRSYLKKVFEVSQYLVPKETGRLAASGHIQEEAAPGYVQQGIVYDTRYAIYVHEDLSKKHLEPTQAKFLEEPFYSMAPLLDLEINKEVRGMVEETWRD